MKYFFLSDGWTVTRVWGAEGLWNETAWRRSPQIERLDLCLVEKSEKMWLYRVEDPVLMVEVKPLNAHPSAQNAIGQVTLKRLISADRVLERLCSATTVCQTGSEIE